MLLLAGVPSPAQSPDPFQSMAAASLRHTLTACRRTSDSLKFTHHETLTNLNARGTSFCDSLIAAAADTLETSQRDSLHHLSNSMAEALTHLKEHNVFALDSVLTHHSALLHRMVEQFTASLKDQMESDELMETLNDSLATLADVFSTSNIDRSDSTLSLLVETGESYRDSIAELTRSFIDDRPVSSLILSLGYDGHVTYRGRDNGASQYAFMPSLSYRHPSGLFATGATSWLSDPTNRWDVLSLSLGYEKEIAASLSVQASYSRYWFRSDSKQSRSVMNNALQFGSSLELSRTTISAGADMDFGNKSEFSFSLEVDHRIECGSLFNLLPATFEPGISALFGQQDEDAVALRIAKTRKAAAAALPAKAKKNKVFGIMDYEFVLPLTLAFKKVEMIPQFTFDIPCNVVDASSSSPFGSFSIEITYTL